MNKTSDLAINGGKPLRSSPMPPRHAVGREEQDMVAEVFRYYAERDADFGYQGHFEDAYCRAFAEFHGGGHADAVATGTIALYVAMAALDLPEGSEVLVSPITDPGTLSAIILNRLTPRLIDSRPGSYNVDAETFAAARNDRVRAAVIVHAAGQAAEMDAIVEDAHRHDIRILEDCSQAHGAQWKGQLVGTFGDIAAFSTMYRKAHVTGACGGVVYSRDVDLYRRALAHADRGKPSWRDDFDDRDPSQFLFPALNQHTDEISCAIGLASLKRLPDTIERRLGFVRALSERLEAESSVCRSFPWTDEDSPFFFPILVAEEKLSCDKRAFAEAVRAEGIGLNPHYHYVVGEWPWLKPYLADGSATPNAKAIRDTSFNLYLNENYGETEAEDAVGAIAKVERCLMKA